MKGWRVFNLFQNLLQATINTTENKYLFYYCRKQIIYICIKKSIYIYKAKELKSFHHKFYEQDGNII